MADMDLSQKEANDLMAMEKCRIDDAEWNFPGPGQRVMIPLLSSDRRENFFLDVTRGTVKLTKATFQNRARQVVVLLRLDIDGPPHRNPDGEEVDCPHLHIYREGHGDKWAIPAPPELSVANAGLYALLESFMKRCNVTNPPVIQGGLF
jgi:hypothetical protein